MSESDDFKKQLNSAKPKKKKIAVPEEFLNNANSYDDKLMVVKMLADREKSRVLLMIKGMLKDAVAAKTRK